MFKDTQNYNLAVIEDNEGDFFYIEKSGNTTFDTLIESINYIHTGALIIALLSLAILIIWEKVPALRNIKVIPGALVVVVVSILLNEFFIFLGEWCCLVFLFGVLYCCSKCGYCVLVWLMLRFLGCFVVETC